MKGKGYGGWVVARFTKVMAGAVKGAGDAQRRSDEKTCGCENKPALPGQTVATEVRRAHDGCCRTFQTKKCWIVIVIKQFWKALYHCYIQAKH